MVLISLAKIDCNPDDVRRQPDHDIEELCLDMAANGLINPITVRETSPDRFTVVAGNRRLAAAKALELDEIECQVIQVPDDRAFLISLAENMHRRPMTYSDRCRAITLCHERNGSNVAQTAALVSLSETTVRRYLAIAALPEEELAKLDAQGDERLTLRAAFRKVQDLTMQPDTASTASMPSMPPMPPTTPTAPMSDTAEPPAEKQKKKSIKSEPWVFDADGKPVPIPEELYSRVYSLVRAHLR